MQHGYQSYQPIAQNMRSASSTQLTKQNKHTKDHINKRTRTNHMKSDLGM